MKRSKRRRIETESTLIITSMVDMFTLLLTFLLNFVSPSETGADALVLPTSTAEGEVGEGAVVDIGGGEVRVNQVLAATLDTRQRLDPGAEAGLGAALGAAPPGEAPLLVRCDKTVPYATLASVLTAAAAAGFPRYELVVVGAGEAEPTP